MKTCWVCFACSKESTLIFHISPSVLVWQRCISKSNVLFSSLLKVTWSFKLYSTIHSVSWWNSNLSLKAVPLYSSQQLHQASFLIYLRFQIPLFCMREKNSWSELFFKYFFAITCVFIALNQRNHLHNQSQKKSLSKISHPNPSLLDNVFSLGLPKRQNVVFFSYVVILKNIKCVAPTKWMKARIRS